MPKDDGFTCEILPDGTIKSTTDPISPANHSSAEAFFRFMAEATGGSVQKQKRSAEHTHIKQQQEEEQ